MRNGLFHVAKEAGSDDVLGVGMWLRPHEAGKPETWPEYLEGWRLWANQVGMNLWYGRGGLNVKASFPSFRSFPHAPITPSCRIGISEKIEREGGRSSRSRELKLAYLPRYRSHRPLPPYFSPLPANLQQQTTSSPLTPPPPN
jgi:hypothetical protein